MKDDSDHEMPGSSRLLPSACTIRVYNTLAASYESFSTEVAMMEVDPSATRVISPLSESIEATEVLPEE